MRSSFGRQHRADDGSVCKKVASLSLGFSMVIAILIGFGLGYLIWRITGIRWLMFLFIFYGVAAAILNVYKAYDSLKKEYDEESKRRGNLLKFKDNGKEGVTLDTTGATHRKEADYGGKMSNKAS